MDCANPVPKRAGRTRRRSTTGARLLCSADAVTRTRTRRESSHPASADAERRMWPARNPVYDLVAQNDVQERAVHVQPAVVFDEAQVPEFVHERADPWPRGAHQLGECFLTHLL